MQIMNIIINYTITMKNWLIHWRLMIYVEDEEEMNQIVLLMQGLIAQTRQRHPTNNKSSQRTIRETSGTIPGKLILDFESLNFKFL